METKKQLSKKQLELLKKEIDLQLELRCIKVETTLTHKEDRLVLTSTKFQTVPMLHTNLSITEFGGATLYEDSEKPDMLHISIRVHANYDGNGVSLFTVIASVSKDDKESLWIKQVINDISR